MSSVNPLTKKLLQESLNSVFEDVYNTWGGDKRIDDRVATELTVPVFTGERLKTLIKQINALMERQEDLPLDNIWRVEIRENHMLKLSDFTMPSVSARMNQIVSRTNAPKFIQESLAVLEIAEDSSLVEGVGKRVSSSVFYIIERGESDGEYTREEGERCS